MSTPPVQPNAWSYEKKTRLQSLWNDPKSPSLAEIGEAMGVSLNAVAGQLKRMRDSGQWSLVQRVEPASLAFGKKRHQAMRTGKPAPERPASASKQPGPPPAGAVTLPKVRLPELVERLAPAPALKRPPPPAGPAVYKGRSCAWPIGEPRGKDTLYCGSPTEGHATYCPEHRGMAYETTPKLRLSSVLRPVRQARNLLDPMALDRMTYDR